MDDVTRGRKLREMREAADLLQRQVGAHFDIDKASVSAWEAGKTNPSRERLLELDRLYRAGGGVLALYGVGQGDTTGPVDGDVLRRVRELERSHVQMMQMIVHMQEQRADSEESMNDVLSRIQLQLAALQQPPG